jgi:CspA family cold shock protein
VSDGKRVTGEVKWFNAEKGFGFIRPEGADRTGDVFLGSAALDHAGLPEPQAGDKLTFIIGYDRRDRPRAEDVARVSEAAPELFRQRYDPVRL